MLIKLVNLLRVLNYLASHAQVSNGTLYLASEHYQLILGNGVTVQSDHPIRLDGQYLLMNCDPGFYPCQETQDLQVIDQLQTVSIDS